MRFFINFMALALIAIGTVEAFFKGLRVMLSRSATGYARREVWLQYMRWLVAGLSFQLAADILATSVAPARDELGAPRHFCGDRCFSEFLS